MDACLSDIWLHKDIDAFAQVFHLILTENVSGKFVQVMFFFLNHTSKSVSHICLNNLLEKLLDSFFL